MTEIGDAYISVHADTKAFRAEMATLGSKARTSLRNLDSSIGKVSKSSEGFETMQTRIHDMRKELNDAARDGERLGKSAEKWLPASVRTRLTESRKRMKDLGDEIARVKTLDFGGDTKKQARTIGLLEDAISKAAKESKTLNEEIARVSNDGLDKYRRQVIAANRANDDYNDRVADMKARLTELRREARRVGDDEGLGHIDQVMNDLKVSTRNYKRELKGLEIGTNDYQERQAALIRDLDTHQVRLDAVGQTARRTARYLDDWSAAIKEDAIRTRELNRVTKERETHLRTIVRAQSAAIREQERMDATSVHTVRRLKDMSYATKDYSDRVAQLRARLKAAGDHRGLAALDENLRQFTEHTRQAEYNLAGLRRGSREWHLEMQRATAGVRNYTSEVHRLSQNIRVATRDSNRMSRSTRALASGFRRVARSMNIFDKVRNSWRQMDRTVRLVLLGLLLAAEPIVGVIGALGGGIAALAGSLAFAVAALLPLVGLLAPFGYGIALFAAGMGDVEKLAPKAAKGIKKVSDAFTKSDLPAFMDKINKPLGDFLTSLGDSLINDTVAQELGDAFAGILTELDRLVNSGSWRRFTDVLEGELATATERFGKGFVNLLDLILQFVTATAPLVEELSGQFERWTKQLKTDFTKYSKTKQFAEDMELAKESLSSVLGFVGSLADVLGALFRVSAGPGNDLLDTMSGVLDDFTAWLGTEDGQRKMSEFFENTRTVLSGIWTLMKGVGRLFGRLFTEETAGKTKRLFEALTDLLDPLGAFLETIGEGEILTVFTEALAILGDIFEVIGEPLGNLLNSLAEGALDGLEQAAPALGELATALGDLLAEITPSVISTMESFADALPGVLTSLADFISDPTVASNVKGVLGGIAAILPVLADGLNLLIGALKLGQQFNIIAMLDAIFAIATGQGLKGAVEVLGPDHPLVKFGNFILTFKVGLNSFLEWLAETFLPGFGGFESKLGGHVQNIIDFFEKLRDDPLAAMQGLLDGITRIFGAIPGAIANALFGVAATIQKNLIDPVRNALNSPLLRGANLGLTTQKKRAKDSARGGLFTSPTYTHLGEAGPEIVVPLTRPLSMVDPAVRNIAAALRGGGAGALGGGNSGGTSLTVMPGAINVVAPESDPSLVAASVLDRLVAQAR